MRKNTGVRTTMVRMCVMRFDGTIPSSLNASHEYQRGVNLGKRFVECQWKQQGKCELTNIDMIESGSSNV